MNHTGAEKKDERPAPPSLKSMVRDLTAFSHVHINIPFCRYRCAFCCWVPRFGKDVFSLDELKRSYIDALKTEITESSKQVFAGEDVSLKVAQFGGGTPSLLAGEELQEILSTIYTSFDQKPGEILQKSIEVRADTVDREKLEAYRSLGINRLSLGFQSFDQQILDRIKRGERRDDFFRLYDDIRAVGFENVSVDILFGFSFQKFTQFMKDLETAVSLDVDRIELNPWIAMEGLKVDSVKDMELQNRKKMFWTATAHEYLEEHGYRNYYHKCYAKPGKESIMQLVIAYQTPYLSFGAGAEYHDSFNRFTNCDIRSYIDSPLRGHELSDDYSDTGSLAAMMVALEMQLLFPEGVSISKFNIKYGYDLVDSINRGDDDFFLRDLLESQNYSNQTQYLYTRQRILNLKKLNLWLKHGLVTMEDDVLQIKPEARFTEEMWMLYSSRC